MQGAAAGTTKLPAALVMAPVKVIVASAAVRHRQLGIPAWKVAAEQVLSRPRPDVKPVGLAAGRHAALTRLLSNTDQCKEGSINSRWRVRSL